MRRDETGEVVGAKVAASGPAVAVGSHIFPAQDTVGTALLTASEALVQASTLNRKIN
jgi:hypothetical protein